MKWFYTIIHRKTNKTEIYRFIIYQLNNNIPSTIGSLTNLRIIRINNNKISGYVPQSIKNLTRLKILDLNDNCLTEFDPKILSKLKSLDTLNLSHNNIKTPRTLIFKKAKKKTVII